MRRSLWHVLGSLALALGFPVRDAASLAEGSALMAYQRLGSIRMLGQSDALYGINPASTPATPAWVVVVSASTAKQSPVPCVSGQWPVQQQFECYQIHLDGPVGGSVLVMINRQPWNFVLQGWQNYNDPQATMQLTDGDEVQFAWTTAFAAGPYSLSGGSNVQPVVTMWLRART